MLKPEFKTLKYQEQIPLPNKFGWELIWDGHQIFNLTNQIKVDVSTMKINSAYSHTIEEFLLGNVKSSIAEMYDETQKSHDAVHQFMWVATKMFPSTSSEEEGPSWHTRSAFLLFHREIFDLAHRSFLEALCASYLAAFILLRSVLELEIKGAFYECFAHKEFRDNSEVLEKEKNGKRLKDRLNMEIKDKSEVETKLEETSATIYDMIMVFIEDQAYRPFVKTIIKQLSVWGILEPIKDWNKEVLGLYKKLSADVHVVPDRTDIGRILLLEPKQLFEPKKVTLTVLSEYLDYLKKIMDIGIVIELNILKGNIEKYDEVKINLRDMITDLEGLELENSLRKAKSLIK